jgi:mono/diheme cytochrome c family protein
MTLNKIKLFAIAGFALPLAAFAIFNLNAAAGAVSSAAQDEPAAYYKKNCAMCHSPKAEKAFDPAKPDAELVEIILKGKKAEKPPHMPGYEAKGMTKEQAQALVTYMRDLRKPSN